MAGTPMCRSKDCPQREKCWRYRAVPRKKDQSYFDYEWQSDGCHGYRPIWPGTPVTPFKENQ